MYYSTEGQIITTEIQLPHAGITGLGSWLFTWKDSPQVQCVDNANIKHSVRFYDVC